MVMNERMRLWGKNIKNGRTALGFSQRDLAEKLNVTQATVSRWEAGLMAPIDDQREALAGVLCQDYFNLFPSRRKAS